ncbi:GerAB/ArcD/ProY family transporter [Bacillus sp. V59.32b]|uniref:GerAB/ArcD/ProY family transporter n=1 Tax=Bacillus sp. V59.32b TaxID=1758642 RepID=UPI000E3CB7E2|nr:GerAB/ArcD/ProY family transporter [Bacillus sp. V59.32b]RFU66518.1 spore gernimation protein [Bacillus sp. V59.32b]
MAAISLFDRTASFGSGYVLSMINRMQMLYFILLIPKHLVHPSMIIGIVVIGLFSQINLFILAKWLASPMAEKGYEGFIEILGKRLVRILAFVGLFFILIKVTTITLGYVEIVHHLIFPSMNTGLLILVILLVCFYISSQGMEKTIRFGIIAFFATIWIIICYIPFYFPPHASLHHLYPIIPTSGSMISWKGLLMVWSSLAGPEYLIGLLPWLGQKQKMLKPLMIANVLSVVEYLILFIATLLFFGPSYLNKIHFPVLNMTRYLQTAAFERIDIILISMHMFHFVFSISLLLLLFYGGVRIVAGRAGEQTSRVGLISSYAVIFAFMVVINSWFWHEEKEWNAWPGLQVLLGAFTYLIIPAFLLTVTKLKGRNA